MDANPLALFGAIQYEVPLHRLECQSPRFLLSNNFDFPAYEKFIIPEPFAKAEKQVEFDMVLMFDVMIHLNPTQICDLMKKMNYHVKLSGRFYITQVFPERIDSKQFGFTLTHSQIGDGLLFSSHSRWFEYTLQEKRKEVDMDKYIHQIRGDKFKPLLNPGTNLTVDD